MRMNNLFLTKFKYMLAATIATLVVILSGGKIASAQRVETYYGLPMLFYVYEIWVPGELMTEGKIVLRYNEEMGDEIFKDAKIEITRFDENGEYYFDKISAPVKDKRVWAGSRFEIPFLEEDYGVLQNLDGFTPLVSGQGYYVTGLPSCLSNLGMSEKLRLKEEGFVCRYIPKSMGKYQAISIEEYVKEDFVDFSIDYYENVEPQQSEDDEADGGDGGNSGDDGGDDGGEYDDGVEEGAKDAESAEKNEGDEDIDGAEVVLAGVISGKSTDGMGGNDNEKTVVKNNENDKELMASSKNIAGKNEQLNVVEKTKTNDGNEGFRLRYGIAIGAIVVGVGLWGIFIKIMGRRKQLRKASA